MARTIAIFFVLGLMVSCASYHNKRVISSVEKQDQEARYNFQMDRGGRF
jgi:hypothetical protein